MSEEAPANVLPLIADAGNREVLAEWLADQDQFVAVSQGPTLAETDFDICVTDQGGFLDNLEALASAKAAADPVLLPYLLILPDSDRSIRDRERGELADQVFRTTVDEIVSTPIRRKELEWRLNSLRRLRDQSLDLAEYSQKLQEFRMAVESAGHAVYITDPDGTIRYANPAFEDITGFTVEEAVGDTPNILDSGEMDEEYFASLWRTIGAGDVWEEEIVNRRKDGELYTAHQTVAPITDDEGAITAYVAIQTDISDLAERERQLETMIDNLPGMVYRCRNEPDWPMELVRGEVEDLTGFPPAAIATGRVQWGDEIVHPEDRGYVWETVQAAVDAGTPFEIEYRIRTAAGDEKTVWERGQVVESAGADPATLEGFIMDVTARRRLEESLRESLRQLDVLGRVLRHNLRNELNVIQSYAELIREGTDGQLSAHADLILDQCDRLLEITEKERQITDHLSRPSERAAVDRGAGRCHGP